MGKSQTEAVPYWPSDSEVNTVGRGLKFSRNDQTVEVIKLFNIWLTVWIKEKENYSSGSHQFTSGDACVYLFIHCLKPRAKLSTQSSVKFTTGKHIMIVTTSKRYLSRLVPQLVGGFFSKFCGKTSRRESASELSKQTVNQKKILILQNELLRKTRSSYSLSTIYLCLLNVGRFMDEHFKPVNI